MIHCFFQFLEFPKAHPLRSIKRNGFITTTIVRGILQLTGCFVPVRNVDQGGCLIHHTASHAPQVQGKFSASFSSPRYRGMAYTQENIVLDTLISSFVTGIETLPGSNYFCISRYICTPIFRSMHFGGQLLRLI